MSYDAPPPPPPPNNPPPPAGPGAAGSGAGFDPKTINPYDWAILGIGLLLFIFSFFSYYTISFLGYSDSTGGWHLGNGSAPGWFGFALGFLSAVVVAVALFAPTVTLPRSAYLIAMAGFALSFLLYLIGFFTLDSLLGHGFSYWLSFILVIIGAVLSLLRAQQTNVALPGPLAKTPKIGK